MQPKHQAFARHGLFHHIGMVAQLIADGRADEVSTVRIKTFLNQQIDLAQVDQSQIDGDFLALADLGPRFNLRYGCLH